MTNQTNNESGSENQNVYFPGFAGQPSVNKTQDIEDMKKNKKRFALFIVIALVFIALVIGGLRYLELKGLLKFNRPGQTPETPGATEVKNIITSSCLIVEESYCQGFKLVKDLKDPKKIIGVGERLPVGAKIAAPFDGYGIILKGTSLTDKNNNYPLVAFISGEVPNPPTPKDNVRAFWMGNINLNKASYVKFAKGEVIGEVASDKAIVEADSLNTYFLSSIATISGHSDLQSLAIPFDFLKQSIQVVAQ